MSFPGDAGKSFVVAFSLAGCKPGVSLIDGRVIPLNPDPLTVVTAQSSLPPFLTGNVGVLDGNGEAVVTLKLNALPLPGLRLWAAAVSIDASAALGISQISTPLLFVL